MPKRLGNEGFLAEEELVKRQKSNSEMSSQRTRAVAGSSGRQLTLRSSSPPERVFHEEGPSEQIRTASELSIDRASRQNSEAILPTSADQQDEGNILSVSTGEDSEFDPFEGMTKAEIAIQILMLEAYDHHAKPSTAIIDSSALSVPVSLGEKRPMMPIEAPSSTTSAVPFTDRLQIKARNPAMPPSAFAPVIPSANTTAYPVMHTSSSFARSLTLPNEPSSGPSRLSPDILLEPVIPRAVPPIRPFEAQVHALSVGEMSDSPQRHRPILPSVSSYPIVHQASTSAIDTALIAARRYRSAFEEFSGGGGGSSTTAALTQADRAAHLQKCNDLISSLQRTQDSLPNDHQASTAVSQSNLDIGMAAERSEAEIFQARIEATDSTMRKTLTGFQCVVPLEYTFENPNVKATCTTDPFFKSSMASGLGKRVGREWKPIVDENGKRSGWVELDRDWYKNFGRRGMDRMDEEYYGSSDDE